MARATREEVQALMNDPRIQAFLDMVSWAEGTDKTGNMQGYNVLFGGGVTSDLSGHPNVTQGFYNKEHNSTASGRYQTTNPTFQEFAKKLGITDFSPQSQDMVGIGLIVDAGAANDILGGNIQNAVNKLKGRWDSFNIRRIEDIYDSYNAALGQRSSGKAQPLQMTSRPNPAAQSAPTFSTRFATGEHYATPAIPGGINFTQPLGMDLPSAPSMPGAPPSDSNIQARINAAMSTPRLALSTDQLSPATIANMEEAFEAPRPGTPVVSYPTSQYTSPTNVALVGNAAAGMPTTFQRPEIAQYAPQQIAYFDGRPMSLGEATRRQAAPPLSDTLVRGQVPTEPFVSQFTPQFEPTTVAQTALAGAITPEQLQAALNWQQAGSSLLADATLDDQQRAEIMSGITQAQQVNDWIANMRNQLSNISSGVINNPLANTQKWPNVLDAQIVRALETTRVPPVGA